jgi:hypothetical protein
MRRSFIALVLVFSLCGFGSLTASVAQEATPESAFADLGLPELNVTVSASMIDGIPETLEAGRYLLTVNAADDVEFEGGVEFMQPVGITVDEYLAENTGATPVAGAEEASPVAGGEEEFGAPPPFFYDSVFAGGVYAPPGESAQVVIDLSPGEWIVEAPQGPVVFEVTGEMPTDLPEPESGATITMGEYIIHVSEGELTSGTQVVKIENIGAQPHFIVAGYTMAEITEDDVAAVLEAEMTGTPAAVDFNPDEDFVDSFFTGTQSAGTTMWATITLEPATYVFLCFFPDIGDGLPHANHGMFEIVEVAE